MKHVAHLVMIILRERMYATAYSLCPVKFVAEAPNCWPTEIVVLANEGPTPRKAKQQRPSYFSLLADLCPFV